MKTSGAGRAQARTVTGGFICCKLWLGCSIKADSISTSAQTFLMAQLTGLELIRNVALSTRPSNSAAAAPMILRNRPVAKPANSEPVSRRPAAPQAAAPLMACRPFEAWQRVRREFGSARQRSHTSCVDNRAVFANPTTCFSSEDGWRGACASRRRDRRLRLLQALVRSTAVERVARYGTIPIS